jgi:hypothetical protein
VFLLYTSSVLGLHLFVLLNKIGLLKKKKKDMEIKHLVVVDAPFICIFAGKL